MKSKKRVLSFLLSLILVTSLSPLNAYSYSTEDEINPYTNDSSSQLPEAYAQAPLPSIFPNASHTESEPNNTRATANLINIGDSITGKIGSSSDIDCFKITASSSGTLSVTMSNIPSGKIFKLCLQNTSGDALVFAANNSVALSSKSFSYNVTSGTTYYIVAYSAGDYSTSAFYTVSTSLSSSGGGSTSNSNILSVIRCEQEKTKWCWAACVQMNSKYKGYIKTQSQIVTYVHGSAVNQTGSMSDVASALNWISSSTFGNASYYNVREDRYQSHILNMIDTQKPVHVACMPSSGSGHSYIIKGYENDGDYLVMLDPWSDRTADLRVSKNAFLNSGFYCYALGQYVTGVSSIKY